MPTLPSKLPEWATSPAAGDLIEPPTPTKVSGWFDKIKPPHNWVNWWWNLVYLWVQFLQNTHKVYGDLLDAITDFTLGQRVTVYEDDNSSGPGVEEIEKDTGMTATTLLTGDIDTCGDLVVFGAGDNDPKGVIRSLDQAQSGGSPLATYVRTGTGGALLVLQVRTNGTITVVGYGDGTDDYVEAFNALTSASNWLFDLDSDSPNDLALINNRVVVIHDLTSGLGDTVSSRHVHCLDSTTGAVVWSYQHSATTEGAGAICSNGRQVFMAMSPSSYGSLANLRALRLSDGFDFNNESGSTGVDDEGLAWNQVMTDNARQGVIACDRRFLFVGFDDVTSGATHQLQCRNIGDGELVWGVTHPDVNQGCSAIVVDQDYVIACFSNNANPAVGYVEVYDKRTGALIWRFGATDKTASITACVAAASDGMKVFCMAEDESLIWQITRGNVPHPFLRVNPATFNDGYRNLKLQPEPY